MLQPGRHFPGGGRKVQLCRGHGTGLPGQSQENLPLEGCEQIEIHREEITHGQVRGHRVGGGFQIFALQETLAEELEEARMVSATPRELAQDDGIPDGSLELRVLLLAYEGRRRLVGEGPEIERRSEAVEEGGSVVPLLRQLPEAGTGGEHGTDPFLGLQRPAKLAQQGGPLMMEAHQLLHLVPEEKQGSPPGP